MVYKKYIKRDGKTFGPYYYESYRDGDKVKTRFVSGPKRKDEMIGRIGKRVKKDGRMILFFVLGVFLLLLIGNLNYNPDLTGNVISEDEGIVEQEINLEQVQIAEQMADSEIVSSVDVRDVVDVEVKDQFLENNKIMEFDTPEGMIELSFDLLNYSEFVEKEAEGEIEGEEGVDSLEEQKAEDFDIIVEESEEKYKWGYDIKLTDLNFMAKIDVKSEKDIVIIDNQTLKIGNNYLSFADLTAQGYVLTINQPVVLEEVNVSDVNVSLNMTNRTEMNISLNVTNITAVNLSEVNISDGNLTEVNVSEINITIPENTTETNITEVNLTDIEIIINVSEEDILDSNDTNEGDGDGIAGDGIDGEEIVEEEESEEETSEENVEQPIEKEVEEEEPEEIEEEPEEEESEPTITGGVIRSITGFVVYGFKGITGFVIGEKNTVSIYIQKDFTSFVNPVQNNTNNNESNLSNSDLGVDKIDFEDLDGDGFVSLGDTINLDPFLIILITKASHLNGNRVFISDIYEDVKEQDGNWSELINENEYVRVVFEQNLTKEKDITIYARSNGSAEIGVYRKDNDVELARFINVSDEALHKIYLTNLSEGEELDTFDLKVFGEGIEFNWIVDPLTGAGSAEDPYQITNCTDLNETRDDLTAYYILTQDIDCSDTVNWNTGYGWMPIGDSSNKFTGDFNGQNYTISDLYISRTRDDIGLFGYVDTNKNITDVGLENVNITGNGTNIGALVGTLGGRIIRCYSTGDIKSNESNVGGLIGFMRDGPSEVYDSYSHCKVNADLHNVGGLVGNDYASNINRSYATGNVSGGGDNVGGLVGTVTENVGINILIQNTYATGNVSGGSNVGGLVGNIQVVVEAKVDNSFWNNKTNNPEVCVGSNSGGTIDCTAIQNNEPYFYDVQEEPMVNWSYPPWSNINDDTDYPILAWQVAAGDTTPIVGLTVISPNDLSAVFNASQNAFFNVTLNVSCMQGSCGTANVSLALKETWCYQETANVSTACGGLDTGLYNDSGGWTNKLFIYDGLWDNNYGIGAMPSSLFINYTKPSRASNKTLWKVKDNANGGALETVNLTINQSCWDFNSSYMAFRIQSYNGACLNEDTLVLMQDGERKISELSEGDLIYSYNSQGNNLELTEVKRVINRSIMNAGEKYYYIYYYIEDQEQLIKATWNHKFYVNGEYVFAEDLKEGDILLDSSLQEREITKIEIISNTEDFVWDLTVEKNHNFFANNILVHNDLSEEGVEWACWNSTEWQVMRRYVTPFTAFNQVYEEAMWWFFDEELINITEGATSFYTNASTNPLTSSSLSSGESEMITFWVNATGAIGNAYTFFAFANLTSNLSNSNITGEWNVSIVSTVEADTTDPVSNFQTPLNNSNSMLATVSFNATFTDETGLANSTLYIWNSTGDVVNTTVTNITGVSNSTNVSVVLPREDNYTWNYLVYDNSSNSAWNSTNWSLSYNSCPSGFVMRKNLSCSDASFVGEDSGDRSGISVSYAGDVNGDGYDDLIIGAPYDDDGGDTAGQSYLVYGSSSLSGKKDLSTANASFVGEDAEDFSGYSVSYAGDVNGDGYDDLIIGAQGDEDGGSFAGQSYLVYGSSSLSGQKDLSIANASFVGEDADDYSGNSVSYAGDVNGDGYDDLIIGAYWDEDGGGNAGQSYLIYGSSSLSGKKDLSTANASFVGEDASDYSGGSVSYAGDVNGDGYDDLIIGAYLDDDGGGNAGQSYLVYGSSGLSGKKDLSTANASFVGEDGNDQSGYSVSYAGDVNGDGYDDLIIGAVYDEDGGSLAGQSYLVYGSSNLSMRTDLNQSNASFIGEDAGDYSGGSVSYAGDVNGDGYDDLIIGAVYDEDGGTEAGQSYLIYGDNSGFVSKSISSLVITNESDYTGSVGVNVTVELNDPLYLNLSATGGDSGVVDVAVVLINSSDSSRQIKVKCIETGVNTGEYHGKFYVREGASSWSGSKRARVLNASSIYVESLDDVSKVDEVIVYYGVAGGGDSTNPVSNFQTPLNNSNSMLATVSFNATFTDETGLANSTLYIWNSTGDVVNTTVTNIMGASNSTNVSVVLPRQDNYTWNYLVYDNSSNSAWNSTNWSLEYFVSTSLTACGNLTQANTVYTLQNNVSATDDCFLIQVNNVTLDCMGYTLNSSEDYNGIFVDGAIGKIISNITIKNCSVRNFQYGIYFDYVNDSRIENSSTYSNERGIYLYSSDSNIIDNVSSYSNSISGLLLSYSDSNIVNNSDFYSHFATGNEGIYVGVSANNNVTNCDILNNYDGIHMNSGTNNILHTLNISNNSNYGINIGYALTSNLIYNNFFNNSNNAYSLGVNYWNTSKTSGTNIIGGSWLGGNYWSEFAGQDLDEDNVSDTGYYLNSGNIDYYPLIGEGQNQNITYCGPIFTSGNYYLGTNISASLDCLVITNSNITLDCNGYTLNSSNANNGIFADGGAGNVLSNITIKNCSVRDFEYGIYFDYVNDSRIENSSTYSNERGIYLYSSDSNIIDNVSSYSNSISGLLLSYSDSNIVNNSDFYSHSGTGNEGIYVSGSSNNVTNCNIFNNYDGVYMGSSNGNILHTLNITNNSNYGINILYSLLSNLFYNNFFNNSDNANTPGTNYWNISKTSGTNIIGGSWLGGNYWENITGIGFSENCIDANGDGICDTNYTFDSSDIDYFPLTFPDSIPPEVNITYPLNTSYSANVSELNYTSSESGFCWWSNSSGVWNSTSVSAGTNWTGLTSIEGSNTWTVYCNDSSGNENSSAVSFFRTPPIVGLTVISPNNLSEVFNATQNAFFNVTLNVSCMQGSCGTINVSLDPEGGPNELWNVTYDSGGTDIAYGVVVDSNKNVYVTGDANNDYRTIKYNSTGGQMWNVTYDGGGTDEAHGIAIDSSGDIYVTGDANNDYYTIKYNSTGGHVWNVTYDSGAVDIAYGIAVDSDKNVYVTGWSWTTSADYSTIKYNSTGGHVWNVTYDSGDTDVAYEIVVDSDKNVYVTGYSSNGVNNDYHTIKYNSTGGQMWNVTYDGGAADLAQGIAIDSDKNVYVTGYSTGSNQNYYTIKYNSTGGHVWNVTYDGGGTDVAGEIIVDSSGNIYVTGWSSIVSADYYTIKYNSTGGHVWNVTYDSGGGDGATGITLDSNNNLYVTGYAGGSFYTIKYSQDVKGLISIIPGDMPFYTNASTNPLTSSSLNSGESELITFWVNATGSVGNSYTFFAYANLTSNLSNSNITDEWNVSIVSASSDTIAPTITFSCSPTSVDTGDTITCACSAVDAVDASPSVSYTANPSTSSEGTFTTSCIANDSSGNSASSSVSYEVSSSGGGEECVNECSLAESGVICMNSTTYKNKTCGNYDSDFCLEWKESYGAIELIPTPWTKCADGKREKVFYDPVCHTEPYTETISCGCVIDFKKGLNFISICAMQDDYTISKMLGKLEGNYEYILEWDGIKKDYNLWNKEGTQEFDSFDKEKSYFVYYTGEPEYIELGGDLFDEIDVPLYSGLNSPVYPYEQDSEEINNIDFYDSSFEYILDWDNTNKRFRLYNSKGTQEISNIEFGKGIYVYSFEDELNYVPPTR